MIIFSAKCKYYIMLMLMVCFCITVSAETVTSGNVTIQYEPLADGGIKVVNIWNKSDTRIYLNIDGRYVPVNANSSAKLNNYASRFVSFNLAKGEGAELWRYAEPEKKAIAESANPSSQQTTRTAKNDSAYNDKAVGSTKPMADDKKGENAKRPSTMSYIDRLNQDEFFGKEAVNAYIQKTNALHQALQSAFDKKQFIIDHDVNSFLEESKQQLDQKKTEIPEIAQQLITDANISQSNQTSTVSLIAETLNSRLTSRQEAYLKLKDYIENIDSPTTNNKNQISDIINYCIIGAIIILITVIIAIAVRRKRKKKRVYNGPQNASSQSASYSGSGNDPAIVVRRKTMSILKKQYIEDVIDNPMYLAIDASDFSSDSAIRKIYIKNTCIKDVYNLYAEDLRNSDNPKEDGCMVLGRWVYDEKQHKYDISLEEVVFPGDDAVFKEYELNFGGKIKLRIADRLRKLRRDTNLQYDLVCWIHSHPGLGVFFSNSDDNVQRQLKHPQHPNFLVAFVVDILTSKQETGIFTYKKDGSMNSKGDIKKMYSLEELHKWALQSERDSFNPENYFNLLENAKLKMPTCKSVNLNNNSIIDLSQISEEQETGIVGWAVGSIIENNGRCDNIVSKIVRNSNEPSTGIIGAFIIVTNMSLPTIQRLIGSSIRSISFVMVYSTKQMKVTTIPVINGELLTDEQFYGDVTIDELKIWTRRKR